MRDFQCLELHINTLNFNVAWVLTRTFKRLSLVFVHFGYVGVLSLVNKFFTIHFNLIDALKE